MMVPGSNINIELVDGMHPDTRTSYPFFASVYCDCHNDVFTFVMDFEKEAGYCRYLIFRDYVYRIKKRGVFNNMKLVFFECGGKDAIKIDDWLNNDVI